MTGIAAIAFLMAFGLCGIAVADRPIRDLKAYIINPTSVTIGWIDDSNDKLPAYEVSYDDGQQFGKATTNKNNFILNNLRSDTQYRITVRKTSDKNGGTLTLAVRTKKAAQAGSPQLKEIINTTDVLITMSWHPVQGGATGDVIRRYEVFIDNYRYSSSVNITDFTAGILSTFSGLQPFTSYNVSARAWTQGGPGPFSQPAAVQTLPSRRPKNFQTLYVNATVVSVRWQRGNPNNDSITYQVTCYSASSVHTANTTEYEYTCTGLRPNSATSIFVAALPIRGDERAGTMEITKEAAPEQAPGNIDTLSGNSSTMVLRWGDIPDYYKNGKIEFLLRIFTSTECSSTETDTLLTSSLTSATLVNLKPYCRYNVSVRGCTRAGCGPERAFAGVTTLQTAPSGPPTDFNVTAICPTNVTVQWKPVRPAERNGVVTMYEVKISDGSKTRWLTTGGDAMTCTFNRLKPGTPYTFSVRAHTAGGGGPYGSPLNVTTANAEPPEAPKHLRIVTKNTTSVTIQWETSVDEQENEGVLQYSVFLVALATLETKNITVESGEREVTAVVTDLIAGQAYNVSVAVSNMYATGRSSDVLTFSSGSDKPDESPVNHTIIELSNSSFTIGWGAIPLLRRNGVVLFYEVNATNDSTTMLRNTTEKENYTVTFSNLTPDSQYHVCARGYTIAGPGPYSRIVIVHTTYGAPQDSPYDLSVISVNSSSASIQWKMAFDKQRNIRVFQYEVDVISLTKPDRRNFTVNSSSVLTDLTLKDLQPGHTYNVSVRGINRHGSSPFSVALSFTTDSIWCQKTSYWFANQNYSYELQETLIGQQINISKCGSDNEPHLTATCVFNVTSGQPAFTVRNNNPSCSNWQFNVNQRLLQLEKEDSQLLMLEKLLLITSEFSQLSQEDASFIYNLLGKDKLGNLTKFQERINATRAYSAIISNLMDGPRPVLLSTNATDRVIPVLEEFLSTISTSLGEGSLNKADSTAEAVSYVNSGSIVYGVILNITASASCLCGQVKSDTIADASSIQSDFCKSCEGIAFDEEDIAESATWYAKFQNDRLFKQRSGKKRVATTIIGTQKPTASSSSTGPASLARVKLRIVMTSGQPLRCASFNNEGEWSYSTQNQTCVQGFVICFCPRGSYCAGLLVDSDYEGSTNEIGNCRKSDLLDLNLDNATSSRMLTVMDNLLSMGNDLSPSDVNVITKKLSDIANIVRSKAFPLEDMKKIGDSFGRIVDQMMNSDDEVLQGTSSVTENMEVVLLSLVTSLSNSSKNETTSDSGVLTMNSKNIAYKVTVNTSITGMSVSEFQDIATPDKSLSEIKIEGEQKGKPKTFIVYKSSKLFQNDSNGEVVSKEIIGAQLTNSTHAPRVQATFQLAEKCGSVSELICGNRTLACAYWDYGVNGWDKTGCYANVTVDGRVKCICNHLTHFAVLLDPKFNPGNYKIAHDVLNVVTIVGLTISTFSLGIVLVTFFLFRRMRKTDSQKVLFSLSLSLLCLNLFFLAGIDSTSDPSTCTAMAAIIHYFLMASFGWTLVEAVLQYLRLVKVLGVYVSSFLLKASLPAWGIPAAIVSIVLAVDPTLYSREQNDVCWMRQDVIYYGVLAPIGGVIAINLILFFIIIWSLCCRQQLRSTVSERKLALLHLRAGFSIFVLLGLTWVFGFIVVDDEEAKIAFQAIFCVLNSLQGVFILYFHIVRERAVREMWWGVCCCNTGPTIRAAGDTASFSLQKQKQRQSTMSLDFSSSNRSRTDSKQISDLLQ